jgi:hypothetical protein
MATEPLDADRVYGFLAELSTKLAQSGDEKTIPELRDAMLHFAPPLTSEFFGNSMVALEKLVAACPTPLSESESERAQALIRAIRKEWFS